jgi:hypothetical protein
MNGWDWLRVVVSGGAWVGAVVAVMSARGARASLETARRKERDASVFDQFVAMCSFRQKTTELYDQTHRQAGQLYALLSANGGDVQRAKYVASTACAWFYKHDVPNTNEHKQFKDARDEVERHLRHPDESWTVPTSGAVYDWARAIGGQVGHPPWLVT